MQQLRYTDEIRAFDDIDLGDAEVDAAELGLAEQLVQQIASEEFAPDQYADGVKQQMLAAIDRKVAGQDLTFAPKEAPKAQVIDIMEALKASLADSDGADSEAASPTRKPAKKSTRTTRTTKARVKK
jgi:DNA end-binding protein Ku